MIVSNLEHIENQIVTTAALQKAFGFLRSRDLMSRPDGRVEIDGDRVFALIQRYETAASEAPKFESHRAYIDIQFILSGREIVGWVPLEQMTVTETYAAEKDICFGTAAAGTWTPVHLAAGQCAVLWPEDGHAPKLAMGAPSAVVKIVVKVAV